MARFSFAQKGGVNELKMQPADLLLVRGDGWMDDAIKDITHSPYSHVAGFVGPYEIVEAQGFTRTRKRPARVYHGQADVFVCPQLTYHDRLDITKYVINEIGGFYDYPLIAVEAVRYLFHLILPYKEPFHSRDCSTLWSDAFRQAVGLDLCPGIRYPSPADLANSPLLKKVTSF